MEHITIHKGRNSNRESALWESVGITAFFGRLNTIKNIVIPTDSDNSNRILPAREKNQYCPALAAFSHGPPRDNTELQGAAEERARGDTEERAENGNAIYRVLPGSRCEAPEGMPPRSNAV